MHNDFMVLERSEIASNKLFAITKYHWEYQ